MKKYLSIKPTCYGDCYSAAGYSHMYCGYTKREALRLFKEYLREKLGVKRLPFSLTEDEESDSFAALVRRAVG